MLLHDELVMHYVELLILEKQNNGCIMFLLSKQ